MGTARRKAAQALGARMTSTAERFWHESDALHTFLVKRADALMGCRSPEDEELRTLADAIDAYEVKRWPSGKVAGAKS